MGVLISPRRSIQAERQRYDLAARLSYDARVLNTEPAAFWPLSEKSGIVTRCLVNPSQNGFYAGPTLNNSTGPDGSPCPLWDGVNDKAGIYTSALRDVFDPLLGSIFIWAKVNAVGVWTDAAIRTVIQLGASATNRIYIRKKSNNNELEFVYRANGNNTLVTKSSLSETGWMALGLTWDKTADEVKAYYAGAQEGTTQSSMDTYSGTLTNGRTNIGADQSAPTNTWHGWLAPAAVYDRVLTLTEFDKLSTV